MNVFRPRNTTTFLLAASICTFTSTIASAAPIFGVVQVVGSVGVSSTALDFLPIGPGGQLGILGALNTGSFSGFNNLANPVATTPIAIQDLMGPPLSGAITQNGFITFGGTYLSGASLNLNLVSPGSDGSAGCTLAAAVGEICTPANSPFNLQDVQDSNNATVIAPGTPCQESGVTNPAAVPCGTAIGFLFSGTVASPTGDPGTFTAQFTTHTPAGPSSLANPTTYQDILAVLEGGGSVQESFSGVITVTPSSTNVTGAPEPGTLPMLLTGIGMVCFGALAKRRRRS